MVGNEAAHPSLKHRKIEVILVRIKYMNKSEKKKEIEKYKLSLYRQLSEIDPDNSLGISYLKGLIFIVNRFPFWFLSLLFIPIFRDIFYPVYSIIVFIYEFIKANIYWFMSLIQVILDFPLFILIARTVYLTIHLVSLRRKS